MRVDLEVPQANLESLPRFQRAGVQARQLHRLGIGLAVLAISGLVLGFFVGLFAPASIWPTLLNNNAAALLVLVAALQSAAGVARWRDLARSPDLLEPGASPVAPAEALSAYERLQARLDHLWRNALAQIGPQTLWLAGWAVLALVSVEQAWNLSLTGASLGLSGSVAAALGLLLAFALLVLERQFAQVHAAEWPEAEALAQLARVAIGVLVASALCLLFSGPQNLWPARLLALIGLLPALVAAELLLRALLSLFSPRRDSLEPRLVATSFIAGLLRWPPQPLLALQDELHHRFGIDLRQIWAFSYMRRTFAPVLLVVLAVGWLLSGVSEVPLQGRGIYERFGKPVAVFGPGLHVGLPWPLGRVLAVENGVVHELATSVDATASVEPDPAEGEAPASANRLWDASHVNEKSQVIASSSGDRQGFQVVNMDVRFVYRIGLSDQAALAATYNSADVPMLIRSTASRVLVHDFASRTLDGLLGEQRTALADDIGRAVQADLQRLDSGVEILATVVEAIHPPAGAANAYHAVQAAQISAQALIARERGAASEQANQARLQASIVQDQAQASAHEVQAGARAADLRFSAERQAHAQAGRAFVLEQYLAQLSQGLGKARLLVLDHRLGGNSAPTIDLRSFTPPADPTPARKAVQPGVTP